MNTGNYNRSPYGGHPHGGFLSAMTNNFAGIPTAMRSPTHAASGAAKFSTGHWAGAGQGRSLNGNRAPPPHADPIVASGIINGIRNLVNGIMNPKLNCDFHLDHNRGYNPKYRNNYMADCKQAKAAASPTLPEPHIQTVMFDIAFGATSCLTTDSNEHGTRASQSPSSPGAEIVAIFSSEDFPELPLPKPMPSVTAIWAKEKSPKPASPKPKPKFAYFEITFATAKKVAAKPPAPSAAVYPASSSAPPASTSRVRTFSEDCDSEESFVLFASASQCSMPAYRPPFPRQRQISECSDDSFVICFTDDAPEGVIEFSDADDTSSCYSESDVSDSSEEEEDEDDDDLSDEGDDCVDGELEQRRRLCKTDRNKMTRSKLNYLHETNQPDSGFDECVKKKKRVRFDEKPTVHVMRVWEYASRAARIGPWERMYHDNCRFKNRIKMIANFLNPVLQPEHRDRIYESRFRDRPQIEDEPATTPAPTPAPTPSASTTH